MSRKVLHTKLCDMLEIEYPVILAGMGHVAGVELTAAVSNAGGLGVLGASLMTLDEMRDAIRRTRELTDKPFGVDLLLPSIEQFKAPAADGAPAEELTSEKLREMIKAILPKEHQEYVKKLMDEIGVEPVDIDAAPRGSGVKLSMDLTTLRVNEAVRIVLEEKVPVFASGLGNPSFMVPDAHAQGMVVMGLVGNVKNARRMAEAGVDIIVAQGHEAGGHTGRIGTLALVPQVIDATDPIPVVAAGGIGDGRGLAASLAMGAIGAWVGTAFVTAEEADENDFKKEQIVKAIDEDTVITKLYTGKTLRSIKNRFIDMWDTQKMPPLPMPMQTLLVAELQASLHAAGKTEYLSGLAGQISGMIKEVRPAKDILDDMVGGAVQILAQKLPGEVKVGM